MVKRARPKAKGRDTIDRVRTVAYTVVRGCQIRQVSGPGTRAVAMRRAMWPRGQGEITVGFLGGDSGQQDLVEQMASEWNRWSALQLRFLGSRTRKRAMVRVSFDVDGGSWSCIGTDAFWLPAEEATVNLGWVDADIDLRRAQQVILHEFGHVLGLVHEHQNPAGGVPWDVEAVYRYYGGPPNYWTREQVDREVLAVYGQDRIRGTVFDPESIMCYPIPAVLTGGRLEVPWNDRLSEGDKAFMAGVYGAGRERLKHE